MAEIVLYQFEKDIGTESASPFCVKVHRALGLKGVKYSVRSVGSPGEMKRVNPEYKKLPVLEVDNRFIPDSTKILEYLDKQYPENPLWGKEHNVFASILEDWADESLYWCVVYLRWQVDSNWHPFAKRAFSKLPTPVRWVVPGLIRKKVIASLAGQGIGRLSLEQVLDRVGEHLQRLDAILEVQGWLSGETIGAADISIFGLVRQFTLETMPQTQGLVAVYPRLQRWLVAVDTKTQTEHTVAVA